MKNRNDKIKSEIIGAETSGAEVLNVSPHGFWLAVKDREYFLDFETFPWFKEGTIVQIRTVELLHENPLHWPELDVDLDLERIIAPEKFALVYRK